MYLLSRAEQLFFITFHIFVTIHFTNVVLKESLNFSYMIKLIVYLQLLPSKLSVKVN